MAPVVEGKAELISATPRLVLADYKSAASHKATPIPTRWVPARELSITWGGDTRYWRWLSLEDDINVEVAQLLDVCWLELKGNIPMKDLSPGSSYSVILVLMMIDPSGFEPAATFSLTLPNGDKQKKTLSLAPLAPKQWLYLKLGGFVATGDDGDIIFSLTNKETLNWKKGLIVAGFLFQPPQ